LHPRKYRERGYNQLDTFGTQLSALLGVPYEKNLLTRPVYTKTQTHKDREHRLQDIEKAFAVTPKTEFENKHFLLIDDVITTGATLELCGRLLLQIPGTSISIAALAATES
jgi:ComF family protein